METVFGVIGGIVVLVVLVVLHELGHAIVALRNGVVVEEFGIGFPPKAWGKKLKNGILFTLNWLPLGGFVRLKGEYDSARKKGEYGAASYWAKTKILFAGVFMNWLVAAILFTILAVTGMPKILPDQFSVANDTRTVVTGERQFSVADVEKDSAAAQSDIKKGDEIVELNHNKITDQNAVQDFMTDNYGKTVTVTIMRDGKTKDVTMTLPNKPDENGAISGIVVGYAPERAMTYSTWSAPIVGVGTTAQLSWVTLDSVGKLLVSVGESIVGKFSNDAATQLAGKHAQSYISNSVAGPVGLIGSLFPQIEKAGVTAVVFFIAIISLSLAVMNVLPIPALDGGRWFVMTLFRLFKKDLTKEREENIQSVSMLILLGLFIVISIGDIAKIVG